MRKKKEKSEGNNSSNTKNLIGPDGKIDKSSMPKLKNNKSSYK